MDKKILFVDLGGRPHPIHRKFANTVTKEFAGATWNLPKNYNIFSWKIQKNYDIYLIEAGFIRPVLLRILGKINKKSKIINIFADPRLFYLNQKEFFDLKKNKTKPYSFWRLSLNKFLLNQLDGALFVGKFSANLFRKQNKKIPIRVTYSFIPKDNYNKIIKIKPSLQNHNILFIGNGPDSYCKGMDFLIDVFKIIKKKNPDAKLYILGKWDIKEKWKSEDVYFEGNRNIIPYLKKCSLGVHLGKGDNFPGSVLETLLAGIPFIISKYVGTKEVVEKVNGSMVIPLDKKDASEKIMEYFNSSTNEKKKLSKKCKKVAKEFSEEKMLRLFKKQFSSLIQEIYEKEI